MDRNVLYVCDGITLRLIKEGNSAICEKWMNLEDITPSEKSKSQKHKYLHEISKNN